jgi:hypothetical protein
MTEQITASTIESFRSQLEDHPVYSAIHGVEDLRLFMSHHVYSVWDFMSLIKYLQGMIAPTSYPWLPGGDGDVRRFINELVLEEESDEALPGSGQQFGSHFELYCQAMREIGADAEAPLRFIERVRGQGVTAALAHPEVPAASRAFTGRTFAFIDSGKPHTVAAALALGREHIIPCMFRALLDRIGIAESDAPAFHYYLKRHIHLDEDFHAPLSLRLLNGLCGDDPQRHAEAVAAGREAVGARLQFWDGVLDQLNAQRQARAAAHG